MTEAQRRRLRQIKTFADLIPFLIEELNWPIDDDLAHEDITFEWSAEELGLTDDAKVSIGSITQLRPLEGEQPWGIFFIDFEKKKLPIVILRRILNALVVKKRASANPAELAAWQAQDLLFISAFGEEEEQRQISFAHFGESKADKKPTLRVLGWDEDDTNLKIDYVAHKLGEKLTWPDDPTEVDAWREQWSQAFELRPREVINTSKELAIRLADLAKRIRARTNLILSHESEDGSLRKLMAGFKTALIHDLSEDDFADMYAQTITYGLFSAAVSRTVSSAGTAVIQDNVTDMVPITNPFLREMLQSFIKAGGRKNKLDFDELGIQEVVDLLNDPNTHLDAVLRDFGNRTRQQDPVVHFYEDFLKEYDKRKKVERGVFYTPQPVVSYIVRSIDDLLQIEFGLEDGLASTDTWADMTRRFPKDGDKGLQIPDGTEPASAFVQILDPATGTGTFLVEVIDVVHKTMSAKWRAERLTEEQRVAAWNSYVSEHLLPRLHGYELMMAPYAIAHVKLGLKLWETGYKFDSEERARVYLTNALEPAADKQLSLEFLPALAHEARAVNEIKCNRRFTAIIGNPPYSGLSSNMGPWIDGLLKGKLPDGTVTSSYYHVDGEPLGERKLWLQDDYVKFTHLSQWLLNLSGAGVHGYITNHGYLDNPTFRGMRWSLMDSFENIRVLDLHGNLKKKESPPGGGKDVNVFDIQQGVAIGLFSKKRTRSGKGGCCVQYAELWGERGKKYDCLADGGVMQTEWLELEPSQPFHLFEPLDVSEVGDYYKWPAINEVMPINVTGIVTARDAFVIDFDRDPLRRRIADLRSTELSDDAVREKYFAGKGSKKYPAGDSRGWKLPQARQRIRNDPDWDDRYAPILYRPFDSREIYYVPWMVDWPRTEAMPQMLADQNLGLVTTRQTRDQWGTLITSQVIAHKSCAAYDINSLFPLYLNHGFGKTSLSIFKCWPIGKNSRTPNLDPAFVETLEQNVELTFESDGRGNLKETFGPEDFLAYIYAIFHSPEYRRRYEPLLKLDFPRVPSPDNANLFCACASLGHELLELHLLESPLLREPMTSCIEHRNPQVGRVGWSDDTVWLDAGKVDARAGHRAVSIGTVGFEGVPEEVWDFQIGGYQVCHKWLKDRKGRTLSDEDICHYHKIVAALSQTILLMTEIDEVIEQYGGWPDAFQIQA